MLFRSLKSLWVAVFSLVMLFFCNVSLANDDQGGKAHEEKKGFDVKEVIFDHVLDAHEFHFMSWESADGEEHELTIPLPVILYSSNKGLSVFMASRFEHGHAAYDGYLLLTKKYMEEHGLDKIVDAKGKPVLQTGMIYQVDEQGVPIQDARVYDFSLTRNVVQMFIALILLTWLMTGIAKKYKSGIGVKKAPTGWQNALEPVITFVRDEVARPNLGVKWEKYMPFLLTVFFFILINNLIGLIPGSANVTGNISFTLVLGVMAFIVILISTNKHYWGHIFNPPVPGGVKPILILVEFMSVFTKPFALIIRLFANMLAGHIIIICLISLIFIFGGMNTIAGWGFTPISVGFVVFIYFIELLVAFLQAYIFTMLAAVFIGQAFEGEHHDGHDHDDAVII